MKSIQSIIIIAAFFLTSNLLAQDKLSNNLDDDNIALEGYSPVSYLDLKLAQKGSEQYQSVHEKVVYYFTSAAQKATFDKNPIQYLPQYGGYCAYGATVGSKLSVDPDEFIVEDGKYFLFYSSLMTDAKEAWLEENNHEQMKAKADKNWVELRKSSN